MVVVVVVVVVVAVGEQVTVVSYYKYCLSYRFHCSVGIVAGAIK